MTDRVKPTQQVRLRAYYVCVTRDVTESTRIQVRAVNWADAERQALHIAREDNTLTWDLDEGNLARPYIPDPGNSAEEAEA